MTEIERIIQKGFITEDFLREEVRNDFLVTNERKKLWAVILDLVNEFDIVCKKHGFTYYMIYGTLLGAVRHKGFIPWDDDFDVAMPREDYDRFIQLKDEFKNPFFLQTPYTDPESCYTYAKIRNSNTTGLSNMFKYQKFNHGIWITIFPLDYWEVLGGEERYNRIRQIAMNCGTYMRLKNPNLDEKNLNRVRAYHSNPIEDYEEVQRLASSCKDPASKYVMTATITIGTYEQKLLDAADFQETIPLDFEGLNVLAPCGYKHLLKVWYNDYMQLPPIEERGNWHADGVFDADIPYKDYLRNQGIEI